MEREPQHHTQHPGEFLEEKLRERGWTQTDLAEILEKPKAMVSEIISGKRGITSETASLLADALGPDTEYWIRLQLRYDLAGREDTSLQETSVARKAHLYSKYPIREMVKRGWLKQSSDVDLLEEELKRFFSRPEFPFAARRKEDDSKEATQIAWLYRTNNLANELVVKPYSELALVRAFDQLKSIVHVPEEIPRIARILSEAGVRFVVVEALPSSKIDGVCFWLDERSPVVAVSLRFDRIDHFWFTLIHELEHVRNRHGLKAAMLDVDLMQRDESVSEEEKIADEDASGFLIPKSELDNFIARVYPLFTPAKIVGFARRIRVHPGIVVGQLQYRDKIDYSHHRKMLVKVRSLITQTAIYDGWGMTA